MILDPDSPDFTAAALGEGTPESLTAFQNALEGNPALRREAGSLQQTALLLSCALKSPSARPISPLPRPVPVMLAVSARKPRRRGRSARSLHRRHAVAAVIGLTVLVLSLFYGYQTHERRQLPVLALERSAPSPVLAKVNVTAPPDRNQAANFSRPAVGPLPAVPALLSSSDLPEGSGISRPLSPPVALSAPPPEMRLPRLTSQASQTASPSPEPAEPGMYASPPQARP